MDQNDFRTGGASRRAFLGASMGLAAAGMVRASSSSSTAMTAGEVVDRIRAHVGIPWREQTVDRIVAGAADRPVEGIATTMMATLDVIRRAAERGKNLVITHEPTFYTHQDRVEAIEQDPIYRIKRDFLDEHGIVVFHFHDHWHGRRPDGIAVGMARRLGWEGNADPGDPRAFTFPATPLARLAREIAERLAIRTVRVVGDPGLSVRRVAASWGNVSLFPGLPLLARQDVEVLVVGETNEWELVEYAQDAIAAGARKALIILGHVVSEQAGMEYCAEWLRGFIDEVPIEFLAAAEPFWHPEAPHG